MLDNSTWWDVLALILIVGIILVIINLLWDWIEKIIKKFKKWKKNETEKGGFKKDE